MRWEDILSTAADNDDDEQEAEGEGTTPLDPRWSARRHPGCSIERGVRLLDLEVFGDDRMALQHRFATMLMVMALYQRALELRIEPDLSEDPSPHRRIVFELDASDKDRPPPEDLQPIIRDEPSADGSRHLREIPPLDGEWAPTVFRTLRWIAGLDGPRHRIGLALRRLARSLDGGSLGAVSGRFRLKVEDLRFEVLLSIDGDGPSETFCFRFGPVEYPPSPSSSLEDSSP